MNRQKTITFTQLIIVLFAFAGTQSIADVVEVNAAEKLRLTPTVTTLKAIVRTEQHILEQLALTGKLIAQAESDSQKAELQEKEQQLRRELSATRKTFDEIAAENSISALKGEGGGKFDLKSEVLFLLEPALKEMKRMTSGVRSKSELREKLEIYDERLPIADSAINNLQTLLGLSDDKQLSEALETRLEQWSLQQDLLKNDRQSAQLQLDKLEAKDLSLADASKSYFKEFFQKRGLYLTMALSVVLLVVFLSKLTASMMRRVFPGFRAAHRSFRIRLIQLLHIVFSFFLAVIGPMIVFYAVEDWVLFSVGLLILFAAGWTIRSAVPRYWHQMQLFLNVGSVREGERLELDGMPWLVKQINLFTTLENPTAGLEMRLPIDFLVGQNSRPYKPHEPWFPCRTGDWVVLGDGRRGRVVGISREMVQLIQRGGGHHTYLTADFLSLAPHNLSTDFRLKEVLGISYSLQKEATKEIPEALKKYIEEQIEKEGYAEHVQNLLVEFSSAGASSLDITVIIDFSGEISHLYGRLCRSVQRWSVDACTVFNWEIPFPQMTIHKP